MKVLLLGSGGRESALAWKMAKSNIVSEVVVSPGNGGMTELSEKINLVPATNKENYLELKPDLVVVGPEAHLADGIVDFFEAHKILVVGPTQAAARLESSKAFCKEILVEADIPTSAYEVVTSLEEGLKIIEIWPESSMVIKVDELAQGKGVVVAGSKTEAKTALTEFFNGTYLGYKVNKIVIEDVFYGEEASAFALCDGEDFIYLGSASDYKRLSDGDTGPNTGGMGTVSPSPILTQQDEEWIKQKVFFPLLEVMKRRGYPFKGFLFAGLMKNESEFTVLEFNVRLGDPETQSLLPRINQDIVPLLVASAKGELKKISFTEAPRNIHAVHVVMTAKGYPGVKGEVLRKGDLITKTSLSEGCLFFPAGVSKDERGLFTNGGRVCGVTSVGESLQEARMKTYTELLKVGFEGAHYRKDIGERFL